MAVYLWVGKTREGEIRRGEMASASEASLRVFLRGQGLTGVKVEKKRKDLKAYLPFSPGRVREKEVAVFARQFATMVNAGLPIMQCLDLLSSEERNRAFARVILSVRTDIGQGQSLTEGLSRHPAVFDDLFVNLIAAGEAGGVLDVILNRLAGHLEKTVQLKRKLRGALVYPASVLLISSAVIALLLWRVVPVFDDLFRQMGSALPAPTRLLVDASGFVQGHFLYGVLFLFLSVLGFGRFYKTERGRHDVDRILLKLPVFGTLFRKVAVARFSRTLSTLVSSGVPILEGLEIVGRVSGNKVVENVLVETRKRVTEGNPIAETLARSRVFPPMVVQMIGVGESTGTLDTMLDKIADFYDQEVDAAADAMTSLLEPVMMVVLGGLVGGMIVALSLSVFRMAGVMGG